MNLAIRGIDAQIEFGDSFRNDRHPDLRADYILANPPFNISEWNGDQLREDKTTTSKRIKIARQRRLSQLGVDPRGCV